MQTVEVARRDWTRHLNEFTAIHEGWLISLDLLGPELGAQPEIENLPLLDVSANPSGAGDAVTVSVARSAADHFTHVIPAVARVWVERTDEGADAALQFESADGTHTILRLRTAVQPETVDGLPRH